MYAVGDASGQWTGLRLADLWAVLSRAVPGSVSASNRTAVTRPALGMLASPWAAPIHRVVIDSRQAGPDTLFVALRGEQTDGHRFVGDAFARGAVCAIVEQCPDAQAAEAGASFIDLCGPATGARALPDRLSMPLCLLVPDSLMALQQISAWWRSLFNVRVIGITGSIGKTTTKEYVGSVLSQRYNVLKSEGNYNNEIGLPLTLLRLDPTIERAVLEMGTYGLGEIRLLTQIARPQVGLVTNVGPVHLERMGTIERIVQAKSELPQALPPDGVAILNADDERVRSMAGQTSARVFTYGQTPGCDLWADQVESLGLEGLRLRLHWQSETIPVQLPAAGRHSVYTALRAAAVGLVEGLSWPEIVEGLRTGEQLRLTPVPAIKGATLIDDTYNSSPESALAALDLLAELEGRKIAVLGDMLELGPAELEGHHRVARRVIDVVSVLVTVGERGRWFGEHALELGMPAAQVLHAGGNEAAIAYLKRVVQPGDKVLVKGSRGMAMEQIVQALARK